MKYFIFLFIVIGSFSSCSSVDPAEQFDKDIELIEKYIKDNNLVAEKTVHGLYYVIETPGGMEKPVITNKVTATYSGKLIDKREFDSGDKVEFDLFNVIEGWQIGIPKFGKGGKGKLLIPSRLGYGSREVPTSKLTIPAHSVLVFDIELLDWK